MTIRLQVGTDGDRGKPQRYARSPVRIGRDPEGDVVLAESRAVSWHHAQIEFASDGVYLTDLGSSNGTLLNGVPIEQPSPLSVGDRIQLGYTGPTVQVLEVSADSGGSKVVPVAIALGVLVLFVGLGFTGWWLLKRVTEPVAQGKEPTTPTPKPNKDRDGPPPKPPIVPNGSPIDTPSTLPSMKSQEVGRYVSLPQLGPSGLLQRSGEAYPWTVLRPEGKIATTNTLVSLPGYRSVIELESGVQLTLWGNVPEFSEFPPVLESAIIVNAADKGDLDFILLRGRVHVANRKQQGQAQLTFRFLRHAWKIDLLDTISEVSVELWTLPSPPEAGPSAPQIAVGLFSTGPVRLTTEKESLVLDGRSRVSWVNSHPDRVRSQPIPDLPSWWKDRPDPTAPEIADVMLSLVDWSRALAQSRDVVDTMLTQLRESTDPTFRVLGVLFLNAIDAQPNLVEFLTERAFPEVRGSAAQALRSWLQANPDNAEELKPTLEQRLGYSKAKAALVVELLQPFSAKQVADPQTYQRLIALLDHDNLPVRDSAYWHLSLLAPKEGSKNPYDPSADVQERRRAIDQWKAALPAGSLPSKLQD